MRVLQSWLTDVVGELPEVDDVAEAFVRVGFEVERVDRPEPITGPLVVGRVLEIEQLDDFKKPIRWCQVEVGPGTDGQPQVNGVICGATNFAVGDLVVVTLPGTVLPGGFEVTERKTYGHLSQGMLAAADELGIGSDHTGILVLPAGTAEPGDDPRPLLGLDPQRPDPVIELDVNPDSGYCFSVRGLGRELAAALDREYLDPAGWYHPNGADGAEVWPVRLDDPACPRFVARRVDGVRLDAPSPWWMQRRLLAAGMRPISLIVDVTNYVMIELGQPLHAYDATKLSGPIVVRRATAGEQLTTLDDVRRTLDPDDLLITDDSGPIGMAGVMGGAATEIAGAATGGTVDVLLEGAHFDPAVVARGARRHKLPSEASKRFERVVDPELPPVALERAVQLLVEHGGGRVVPGGTDVGAAPARSGIEMALDLPDRVAGVAYPTGATTHRLRQVGCDVELLLAGDGAGVVQVLPPSWRPDLTQPADLVEEVLRLEGYQAIPSVLPAAPPGRGLSPAQLRRRAVSRALAEAGYVEVLPFPFVGPAGWDALGLPAQDVRRRTVRVLNPIATDRDELASTLLPGLLDVLAHNRARGATDLALYHVGQVVLPHAKPVPTPDPGVADRPSDDEYAQLRASLPAQPVHVAVVLAGDREPAGWWGDGREAGWQDAVQAARLVGRVAGVELRVTKAELAPWHPGRCAALRVGDWIVGHAGELHPKVIEALELPPRTCAMELDLDQIPLTEARPAPRVSPYPPISVDVALVAGTDVPVADLAEALAEGGGELLEDVRLFDVYSGEQVGEGQRSLAYALRFRAPDRTLTNEEANTARDAAVAMAARRYDTRLR